MSERDMTRLLALIEAHLGKGWIEITDWLRDQATLDDIEQRLRNNDIAGVIEDVQQAALRFAAETHSQYLLAGRETADWLRAEFETATIHFDEASDLVVARARQNQLQYVRGLGEEQRQKINRVLYEGAVNGTNPREMARDIRDGLGLTPAQDAAVQSYRRALEQGDYTNALGRELSSGHSDRTIAAARARGEALTQGQVDTAVERYRANFVAHRAESIAHLEGMKVLHQGNDDAIRQAIDRGDVEADALEGEWNHAGHGPNSRPGHVAMQDQKRPFGQPFENPVTGIQLLYPHDPNAPISERAGCRCVRGMRLVA